MTDSTTPSEPRTRTSSTGRMRLFQCPGCWAWATLAKGDDWECECGEVLTVIDLREAEAAESAALDADLRENLHRALIHDRGEDTGDVWLHREDADRLAALLVAEPAALDVERLPITTDKHQSGIDIASILRAVLPRYRLHGLWVQYHGDGTDRAGKNEVVVSIQYGWSGYAMAEEGRGRTVREATTDLLARLQNPDA